MSVRRRRESFTKSSYNNSEGYFPFHRQLITFRHVSLCRQFTVEESNNCSSDETKPSTEGVRAQRP